MMDSTTTAEHVGCANNAKVWRLSEHFPLWAHGHNDVLNVLVALAVLLLLSCVRPTALGPTPYVPTHRDVSGGPSLVGITDSSLASLGLPSLSAASLPPNYRELRFSRGTGMILGAEYPLIRIVESPTEVVGEVIHFRAILSGTAGHVRLVRWAARTVKPTPPVDWRRVVALLDSAGIETLEAPHYQNGFADAGDLVVEVLRGSHYRSYEVNAPGHRTDTAGREAARIAALVDSLDRLADRP